MSNVSKTTFALIGAAGYIAPRHMRAIKDVGGDLIAAYDPFDSVGILDSYFPDTAFFTEFERFDRHLEKLRRIGQKVNYVSICSPNYLHDAHIRFGLRLGAQVICEKPVVLNPWNVDALQEVAKEMGGSIYTILQLRLHPAVRELRERVAKDGGKKEYEIDLTYLTSRGTWYYTSWKGDETKSGGIATNIGVHFFDMLMWVFGPAVESQVHVRTHDTASGVLQLERARVKWYLSINAENLPIAIKDRGLRTYRALHIGTEEFEFSGGFTELHSRSYEGIRAGEGFGLQETRAAIELVHSIRTSDVVGLMGEHHPLATQENADHPFSRKG